MKIEKLNFVHFFAADKEYLLEVDTIKYVELLEEDFSIVFICDEIPAVAEFFARKAEEEFIFFFGNFEQKYDMPVVSRTGYFKTTYLKDKLFTVLFNVEKE